MKTNKKHIIIPALMMAVGVGLVGSISGTVAWYQYSTRVTTSFTGASAHCTENLQVSLTGDDAQFKSELETADIASAATANANGSNFQPVTNAVAHTTAVVSGEATYNFKGHPVYQNFEYANWRNAPVNSYLQYDLYFRVLDVDGATTKNYIAKDLYFEDFTVNFLGTEATDDEAFIKALRFQFDQVNGTAKSTLLSKEAVSAMKLGGNLDLNGDNAFDQTQGYEWETRTAKAYGDESMTQTTDAWSDYVGNYDPATGLAAATKSLGTTVAGTYAAASALHFKVTIWLEGWHATGTTAATSIWDAKNYIGNFQIGMTFGITDHETH